MNNPIKNEFEDSHSNVGSSTHAREPLSRDGARRRAEMLGHLQAQMAKHHELRRRQRGAWCIAVATTGLLLIAAFVVSIDWHNGRVPGESIANSKLENQTFVPSVGSNDLDSIAERSSVTDRLSNYVCTNVPDVLDRFLWTNLELTKERLGRVEQIDDDELIQLFAETGMSAFVGTVGGEKTVIVTPQQKRPAKGLKIEIMPPTPS